MTGGRITILGCGGSGGVPLVTGHWGKCDPNNPKNERLRASIAIETAGKCLVVDTGPDFRTQTLKYGLKNIDAVLYTHAHSDHINGADELRYVMYLKKQRVRAYGDDATLNELQTRFSHLFVHSPDGLYEPVITVSAFRNDDYGTEMDIEGVKVVPFWQSHGVSGRSLGYRLGDFAYSTDVSALDDAAFDALQGIRTWLVDCGQFGSEFTVVHPNLPKILEWNTKIGAKRVILTHLTPAIDYEMVKSIVSAGYEPAFDGMTIDFSY